ncbi:isoleucine--tRNA ligase [Candidatus Microgenomates bacterium]|nr:isoleucine--tRNA ligase [Candidatus Microgenomates bacterium]
MFKPVDPKVNFPALEEKILARWESEKIFAKSVEKNKGKKNFVFYEGPPTANGKPGSHHVEARVFKDFIPRYKTMKGFYCERKGGWDCHGLPVELEVEKKLAITGKSQIEEFGVEKFCKLCRESVFEYVNEWEKLTKRIGFWIGMKNSYETMENTYIESGWWILKQVWNKGWLYEDYKVVPYCARCGTSLSSHELALGYKDNTQDPSLFVKFKVKNQVDTFFLAWTTTPWTLPGNVALAVDPTAVYIKVKTDQGNLILAEKRLVEIANAQVITKFKGKDLLGWEYESLFNWVKYDKKAHFIVEGNFVSLEEGTGIVHTAVMYGEDDFELGKKFNLPKKHVVNEKGQFTEEIKPWAGLFVKKADPLIIKDLEEKRLLYKHGTILHTYPFCWRCGTPLLYYALTSWYLKTTAVKKRLLANNNSVNWIPRHIKNGRMGEWLKNNRDWALSRSRYWGTPLPIWRCQECQETICIESLSELEKLSGKNLQKLDLHRPYIDEVSWPCKCGKGQMKRLAFVLDCWFDSGAMPFAQWHYPFENKEVWRKNFPADYICEAIDQTRGWFYTLQAVSSLLEKESPYKNVICLGHALDEKGNKMSKSKGNVVDPWSVINEAGVDAMRWYFYSVISPGESFRFSVSLVKDVNRRFLLILWNIYNFLVTYANFDDWQGRKSIVPQSGNILDRWLLTRFKDLVYRVTKLLDAYDIYTSTGLIETFVGDFSNWYIRRSRDRIGPSAVNQKDKEQFYQTCYYVLSELTKLLAPFTPFIADEIYQNLTFKQSVHLESWPQMPRRLQSTEKKILAAMVLVRKIVELGHAQRKTLSIKLRQPLASVEIKTSEKLGREYEELLLSELNVKKVIFKKSNLLEVSFDTKLTRELENEGTARELVRKIQEERKKLGCRLDEKVEVNLPDWPEDFSQYLKTQTLASKITKGEFAVNKKS